MRSQLPPDPEWSRLERWILPVVYHGQSLSSAAFFCAWSFLVAFFMGATAVYTAFHYRPDWSILILVLAGLVCLWCLLAGECLRRHAVRLSRHERWRREDRDTPRQP